MKESSLIPHAYKLWLYCLLFQNKEFKKTALQAKISQSALSQNMSIVEQLFQQRLYQKNKGKLVFTAEGIELEAKIRPLLEAFHEIKADKKSKNIETPQKIKFASYESMAVNLFPRLCEGLRNSFPNCSIEVSTHRSDEVSRMVMKGAIDYGLLVSEKKHRSLQVHNLGSSYMGLFVSSHMNISPFNIETLSMHLGLVGIKTPQSGKAHYLNRFEKYCGKYWKKKSVLSSSFELSRQMALKGGVVAVLPSWVAQREPGQLKKIEIPPSVEKTTVHSLDFIYKKTLESDLSREILLQLKSYFY